MVEKYGGRIHYQEDSFEMSIYPWMSVGRCEPWKNFHKCLKWADHIIPTKLNKPQLPPRRLSVVVQMFTSPEVYAKIGSLDRSSDLPIRKFTTPKVHRTNMNFY